MQRETHKRIWFHRRTERFGLSVGAWSTRHCFQTLTPTHDEVWTQENFQWNQNHHRRVYFQGEIGRGTFSAYRPALERIGAAIKATFPVNSKHCLDHLHKPYLAFFPLLQTSLGSCQTPHLRTEKSREGGERGLALTMFQNSCCFSKLQNSNYFIAGDTLHACTTHFPLEGRLVHCHRRGMTTQGRTPHSFLSPGTHTFFPHMWLHTVIWGIQTFPGAAPLEGKETFKCILCAVWAPLVVHKV